MEKGLGQRDQWEEVVVEIQERNDISLKQGVGGGLFKDILKEEVIGCGCWFCVRMLRKLEGEILFLRYWVF